MRSIAIERFGGADRLKPMELPRPRPGRSEVLIRVVAAGVDPVDVELREGHLKDLWPHAFPLIPGWDAAGVVEELGESVSAFRKGDRVWTCARKPTVQWGCYAEYLAVAEEHVALMPSRLLYEEAAAVPLAGLCARQCLRGVAGAGSAVLIHGAAGGIGHLAVQLARDAGARVIACSDPATREFLLRQGAAAACTPEDFVEVTRRHCPEGVDLVLHAGGEDLLRGSLELLKPAGRVASPALPVPQRPGDERIDRVIVEPSGTQLRALARLVDEKRLRPQVDRIYSLASAAEAQRRAVSGHGPGKVVLNL